MGLPINLPRRLVRNKSAFTAEWGNSIREAIWRLSKQKHPIQPAPGSADLPCPFQPYFFTEDSAFYVSVKPSGYIVDRGEMGNHEGRVALFEGSPIVNPDPNDSEWVAPRKSIGNGDWVVWIVDNGLQAEVTVELDSASDPDGGEFIDVWKIGTFTVATNEDVKSATALKISTCNGLEHSRGATTDFWPKIWFDEDSSKWMVKFTQGYCNGTNTGSSNPFTIFESSFDDAQEIASGDTWYAHISTSAIGSPTAFVFEKATDPATIEYVEPISDYTPANQEGEYYYKIVSFDLSGGIMTPTIHHTGSIDWHERSWYNVGGATEIVKGYVNNRYEARTIVGNESPFVEPTEGEKEYPVWMSVELDEVEDPPETFTTDPNLIRVIGKVKIPDAGSHPWKATNNGDATISIAPGKVVSIDPYGTGEMPNLPYDSNILSYAGGDIPVTSASGFIYLVMTVSDIETSYDGEPGTWSFGFVADSITVEYGWSGGATDQEVAIPIAGVSLDGGVATVDYQVLDHNHILQLGYAITN